MKHFVNYSLKHMLSRIVETPAFLQHFVKVAVENLVVLLDVFRLFSSLAACHCTFSLSNIKTLPPLKLLNIESTGNCMHCEIISRSPASENYFINTLSCVLKKQQSKHNTLFILIM